MANDVFLATQLRTNRLSMSSTAHYEPAGFRLDGAEDIPPGTSWLKPSWMQSKEVVFGLCGSWKNLYSPCCSAAPRTAGGAVSST